MRRIADGVFYGMTSAERMFSGWSGLCATVLLGLLLLSPASAGEIRITNDSLGHMDVGISGALVSYITRAPEEELLQIFNLTDNRTSTIRSYSIPPSGGRTAESLCISGDRIAWVLYGNNTGSICLYNITTRRETLVASTAQHPDNLQLDGDWLIWNECQNRMYWIYDPVHGAVEVFDMVCSLYGCNLTTQTNVLVTNMTGFDGEADLDRGRVVFRARPNSSHDLYLHNLASGGLMQITNDSADQYCPAISGDYLVWEENPSTGRAVFLYHIPNGELSPVTDNVTDSDIEGDLVVWLRHLPGDTALYAYSISTGGMMRITPRGAHLTGEYALSDDYVVWRDWRSGENGSMNHQIRAAPLPAKGLPRGLADENNSTRSNSIPHKFTAVPAMRTLAGQPVGSVKEL
jgi:beta propeller repeat protein